MLGHGQAFADTGGGLWLSKDGGNTWWKANNVPVSQFYHESVDNDDPYHVYGGDGFWMFPDPADHNYIYAESQGGYPRG